MTDSADDVAAIRAWQAFRTANVEIKSMQTLVTGKTAAEATAAVDELGVTPDLLAGVRAVKKMSGQIDTFLHAVGILHALESILDVDETIQAVSLGAGTNASLFDLETDRRIAEFKFNVWTGDDASRLKGVFSDVVKLAMADTTKGRYLYLIDKALAVKFLGRAASIKSTLSRNSRLAKAFTERYGERYRTVGEFWAAECTDIRIEELKGFPGFAID